jgi:[NiFe] hydrogenase diaphorase moiety small subunit
MSDSVTFTIDGVEVTAQPGETILQAAEHAGIYIPRLCAVEDLSPIGSCRVCSVKVNGRFLAACTQPVMSGSNVECNTEEVKNVQKSMVEMLFVEGNHMCPVCEESGKCDLQALAYRMGMDVPKYPYQFPTRKIDCSHDDIYIDHDRCILCGACVQASKEVDGKNVFQFIGRGENKKVGVNAEADLAGTDAAVTDKAVEVCPVGALMPKHVGYNVPVGKRKYDHDPIGSDIENKND